MITAQSADGVLHQFPDGTDGAVIDRAMADYVAQNPVAQHSPSLQVNSPAENWSNIGAESMATAGIRKPTTTAQTIQGAALATIPFNLGGEGGAALDTALGRGSLSENYDKASDVENRFAQEHPIAQFGLSLPSNILATMAMPGGPLTQGAVGGALQGGGAGEGIVDRLMKAGLGGVTGLLTSALFGGAGNYANKKALPPEARGADFVQNIADKSGLDVNALPASGKPFTSAEALGPQAQTQLMALARREGGTGTALAPAMAERGATRSQRVLDDMAQSAGIHPEAAKGNIDDLVAAGQAKAEPLFTRALSAPGPIWNADLARLAERPAVKKAMALAAEDLRNADISPASMGLEIDPMMGATGAKQLQPTAKAWDLIRRNLSGTVERDAFGKPISDTISRGNHNINQATRDLTAALKTSIPGYGDALAVSGDYLSTKAAFTQGQKAILDGNVTEKQFADLVKKMDPGDREALKGGIANKLFELAQNGRLRPAQFLTPRAQAKLEAALGPQQAAAFTRNLDQEAAMAAFERRAVPSAGSPTAGLNQAMKEQDNFGQSQAAQDAADALLSGHGPRGIAMRVGGNWAMRQGTRAMDAMRTSGLTTEGRDAAGRLLMLSPNDLAVALRTANTGPQGSLATTAKLLHGARLPSSVILPLLLKSAAGQ